MSRIWTIIVALLLLHGATLASLASDAEFPLTPDPASCTANPVAVDQMRLILATPIAGNATPLNRLPVGTPVGETVAHDIERVLIGIFACLNAGELLRGYASYSDTYLRQVLQGANLATLSTPAPVDADELTRILDIRDIRALPDGRVAATVILDPALIPVDKIFVFILIREGDQWLIDDVLDELRFSLP